MKKINAFLCVFLFLISPFSMVHAQTVYTWQGGGTGWNSNAHWNPSGIPTAVDSVIIPPGVGVYPKLSGSSASCRGLTFQGGGTAGQTRLEISSGGNLNIYGILANAYGYKYVFGTVSQHPALTFKYQAGSTHAATITGGNIEVGKIDVQKTSGYTLAITANDSVWINDYVKIAGCTFDVTASGSLLRLNPDIINGTSAYILEGLATGHVVVTAPVGRPLGSHEDNVCRYHFLGNPITDNHPHYQLDDTSGAITSDFKLFYPRVSSHGHVCYNPIYDFPATTSVQIRVNAFRYDCAIYPPDYGYYPNVVYTNYSQYYSDGVACSGAVNDQTPYFQCWDESEEDPNHTGTAAIGQYGYEGFIRTRTFAAGEGMLANFGPTIARRNNDTCHTAGGVCSGPGPDFGYIDWEGTVNDGNLSRTITYTNNSEDDQDGFNLLGNPYPSPFYLSSFYIDNATTIEPTFQVWHGTEGTDVNSGNTEVIPIEGTIDGDDTLYIYGENPIWIGQGFWCRARSSISPSDDVYFNNSQRVGEFGLSDNGPIQRKAKPVKTTLKPYRLKLGMSGVKMGKDETIIRFGNRYSVGQEEINDASKWMSPGNALYTQAEGSNLAVNSLPFPETRQEIPLEMVSKRAEPITLTAKELNLPAGCIVNLLDKMLKKSIPVTTDFSYTFASPAGNSGSRFALELNPNETIQKSNLVRFNPYMKDGRIQIKLMDAYAGPANFRVTDISGRVLQIGRADLVNNAAQLPGAGMPAGIYTVTLQPDGKTATTQKLVVGW